MFLLQLANVDVVGALDMYVEKGEWEKCLETAAKQVISGEKCQEISGNIRGNNSGNIQCHGENPARLELM